MTKRRARNRGGAVGEREGGGKGGDGNNDSGGGDAEWDRRLRGRAACGGASHKPATLGEVRALVAGYGGAHEWVDQVRIEEGVAQVAPAPPGLSPPSRLALPWRAAGVDRDDPGLYVRVDTGAGVGAEALAWGVVGLVAGGQV